MGLTRACPVTSCVWVLITSPSYVIYLLYDVVIQRFILVDDRLLLVNSAKFTDLCEIQQFLSTKMPKGGKIKTSATHEEKSSDELELPKRRGRSRVRGEESESTQPSCSTDAELKSPKKFKFSVEDEDDGHQGTDEDMAEPSGSQKRNNSRRKKFTTERSLDRESQPSRSRSRTPRRDLGSQESSQGNSTEGLASGKSISNKKKKEEVNVNENQIVIANDPVTKLMYVQMRKNPNVMTKNSTKTQTDPVPEIKQNTEVSDGSKGILAVENKVELSPPSKKEQEIIELLGKQATVTTPIMDMKLKPSFIETGPSGDESDSPSSGSASGSTSGSSSDDSTDEEIRRLLRKKRKKKRRERKYRPKKRKYKRSRSRSRSRSKTHKKKRRGIEDQPEFQEALDRKLREMGYRKDEAGKKSRESTPKGKNYVAVVKSPSEGGTIYKQAVRRSIDVNQIPTARITEQEVTEQLNQIRLQTTGERVDTRRVVETGESSGTEPVPGTSFDRPENLIAAAKESANAAIIQAEKFKAKIANPTGQSQFLNVVDNIGTGVKDDDEFVHIHSHVDLALKDKIRRGEYVDLEKLLKKNRTTGLDREPKDMSLDIITKDGHTFLTPKTDKSNSITGIRKWEQAFRGICFHIQ